jgi:hypothetical protein
MPSDWREALTLIARRTRDAFARHPWTLQSMGDAELATGDYPHLERIVPEGGMRRYGS